MDVFGVFIPNKTLTNFDLIEYSNKLLIPNFKGIFMRDTLGGKPKHVECAIVNLNKQSEPGSHWVCYYKNGDQRIYFDSFGQITPLEIQRYLKKSSEREVIQRNTDIVQQPGTHICGHLCLYVLVALAREGWSFQDVLIHLTAADPSPTAGNGIDIHELIGKLPRPKKGFTLPGHKYTGPYNPLQDQLDQNDIPIAGQEPFNAVDAISMHHDICYRDNNTKLGKRKCDDQMLLELDQIEPKNLRERLDRALVKKIISKKRRLGLGVAAVKWTDQLAEELHKPIRRKFKKRIVFSKAVDDIWAADLVDMQSLSKANSGFKYILMIIDVFSKYGWAVPLRTKTGPEVAQALGKVMIKQKPAMLWTDKGKEFYNKYVEQLLAEKSVKIYSTENDEKASVVERWNRTIKTKMWKYFTANNTEKYIDILDSLIDKYNNTKHRSIGTTPSLARQPAASQDVYKNLYEKKTDERRQKPSLQIGDQVRISKKKKTFEKGFTPNWTEELFYIDSIKDTKPPTYTIKDLRGEPIKGSFYEKELQRSSGQTTFRIEKIIKKRKKGKEALIKWKGYDNTFNSWVPLAELKRL